MRVGAEVVARANSSRSGAWECEVGDSSDLHHSTTSTVIKVSRIESEDLAMESGWPMRPLLLDCPE